MLESQRLHAAIAAAAPIHGVIVRSREASGVEIQFTDAATDSQRASASAALLAFDWSPEAHAAWEAAKTAQATIALAGSTEPIPAAVRRLASAIVRRINVRLVTIGQPAITETEIISAFVEGP